MTTPSMPAGRTRAAGLTVGAGDAPRDPADAISEL